MNVYCNSSTPASAVIGRDDDRLILHNWVRRYQDRQTCSLSLTFDCQSYTRTSVFDENILNPRKYFCLLL